MSGSGTVRAGDGEERAEGAKEATAVDLRLGRHALATKTTATALGVGAGPSIRSLGLWLLRTGRFFLFKGRKSGPRVGFGPMNYLCVMFDRIRSHFYEVGDSLSKRSGVDDASFFYGRERGLHIVIFGLYQSVMVSESILPMILWRASEITKPTLALLVTARMERTADKTVS